MIICFLQSSKSVAIEKCLLATGDYIQDDETVLDENNPNDLQYAYAQEEINNNAFYTKNEKAEQLDKNMKLIVDYLKDLKFIR